MSFSQGQNRFATNMATYLWQPEESVLRLRASAQNMAKSTRASVRVCHIAVPSAPSRSHVRFIRELARICPLLTLAAQFLRDVSTCATGAEVFTQPRPKAGHGGD